jgi:hypothetical protein
MDVEQMATERLEAELVSHAAWEAAGMARIMAVLREWDRREAWGLWECRAPQQWLSWKCGLGYTAATERLRVARILPTLPTIEAAFTGGLLSWSKVRELTRVATPANEQGLVDISLYTTAQQVARLVRTIRRVTRQQAVRQLADREFRWATNDDDGSITISVRLPADRAQQVIATVHAATTPQAGVPQSQVAADAFVELVAGTTGPRPDIIVHVSETGAEYDNGPTIAPEIAECLACDGPVTTIRDTPDGPITLDKQRAPTKSQRRWLALRHRTCQFPGCDDAGSFDAHHVAQHGKGGRTKVKNLARLCWFHHRVVHLHHLQLTLHPDRTLDVHFPDGTLVDRDVPVERFYIEPPDNPDKVAGTWYGDRLDLNDILIGLNVTGVGGESDPVRNGYRGGLSAVDQYRR